MSFRSYCGALPAPEAAANPLGYKFSWSPRGVLLALRNAAKFYENGVLKEIPCTELMSYAKPFHYKGLALATYPNRDSTVYKERYGIFEAHTILRSTLRYETFPELVQVLADIGLLDDTEKPFLKPSRKPMPWKEAIQALLAAPSSKET